MSRHVVIGTAGHVDHGKTALVARLTGVDTDRWAEEKRRGITIDLGFAPLDLGDALWASIVDVPGHEDFVRNMVAGATGIDIGLLIVAADEGVMPQTEEHLAILEFLDVAAGVVAITKADLAEPEWLDLVLADVADRLAASRIAWEPPLVVSAHTGQGVEGLVGALGRAAARARPRPSTDLFRMPVDRVFSVAGAGTVVTGTVWSGSLATGDEVQVLPGGQRSRVRGIEVHGESRERAEPGRRTALALPAVDRGAIARGQVVVSDASWRATAAVDAFVTLLPSARRLTQRSRVRVHLGTAEVMARVTPGHDVEPGGTGAARLRFERPVVCRWGDRGIVRSYSPVTTVGGLVVVDPWPAARPRRPRGLEARAAPEPMDRVAAWVTFAGAAGMPVADLPVRIGLGPTGDGPSHPTGVERVGDRLVAAAALAEAREATLDALHGYQRIHRLEPGMPRELLRRAVRARPEVADHVHRQLEREGRVVLQGDVVRTADFRPTLTEKQETGVQTLLARMAEAGYRGVAVEEAEGVLEAGKLLEHLARIGSAERIGGSRYLARDAADRLRAEVTEEIRAKGRASPSELRERTGLTRKYLIPVLEWLDGEGTTRREGDVRVLGPAAARRDPTA